MRGTENLARAAVDTSLQRGFKTDIEEDSRTYSADACATVIADDGLQAKDCRQRAAGDHAEKPPREGRSRGKNRRKKRRVRLDPTDNTSRRDAAEGRCQTHEWGRKAIGSSVDGGVCAGPAHAGHLVAKRFIVTINGFVCQQWPFIKPHRANHRTANVEGVQVLRRTRPNGRWQAAVDRILPVRWSGCSLFIRCRNDERRRGTDGLAACGRTALCCTLLTRDNHRTHHACMTGVI